MSALASSSAFGPADAHREAGRAGRRPEGHIGDRWPRQRPDDGDVRREQPGQAVAYPARRELVTALGDSHVTAAKSSQAKTLEQRRSMSALLRLADSSRTSRDVRYGRVEDGRGSLGHLATLRFPPPLIEPDVPVSGIRLSDWLHREAHDGAVSGRRSRRRSPRSP
jgi:hypothetical protein